MSADADTVELGRITGLFGVRGWVRVYSHTRPADAIFDYSPWILRGPDGREQQLSLAEAHPQGKGLVARLEGYADRDQAAALIGRSIHVPRSRLPEPDPDEYYWSDLVGLSVETPDGVALGKVTGLMETGANDVLEVAGERQRLIPMVAAVVREVDLPGGRLVADWDPEF